LEKFKVATIYTLIFGGLSFVFLLIGKKFIGGIILGTSAYNAGILWMESIFQTGSKEHQEMMFRKPKVVAYISGIIMGFLNYIVLSITPFFSNHLLVGISATLPLIICIFIERFIYSVFDANEVIDKLTIPKLFLMSFFLDIGLMGLIIGWELVVDQI